MKGYSKVAKMMGRQKGGREGWMTSTCSVKQVSRSYVEGEKI